MGNAPTGTCAISNIYALLECGKKVVISSFLISRAKYMLLLSIRNMRLLDFFKIAIWSALHFLKVQGTPVPFNPPQKMVNTGPYRYARNPMLTGFFMLLFGLGFSINSFSLVLFFTPLYVLINVWELKNIEEPELIKRLSVEYAEYRRNTPMFIPRFRSKSK